MKRACSQYVNSGENSLLSVVPGLKASLFSRIIIVLSFPSILMLATMVFHSCEKQESLPEVVQPIVKLYSEKNSYAIGDTTIITGAAKEYEQDSKIVYKLSVTSKLKLTKFFVTTSSDAVSQLSGILRTEPANAIDKSGNFIKNLNEVIVYYAYYIHPLVPALSNPIIGFNFQNDRQYLGTSSAKIKVIKKGSSEGKPLTIIDLSWANRIKSGIGSQIGLDYTSGTEHNRRGPFFSIVNRTDIFKSKEAIANSDKIDFAGFIPTTTRTNSPNLIAGSWNFVSPSDTLVLTSTYAGANIAKITLNGGATGQTLDISVGGVKKTATYATSTTVTATNFASTANKAAYLAAGIILTNSGAVLTFAAKNDGAGFNLPTTIVAGVGSTLYGVDQISGVPPGYTYNYFSPNADLLMRQTIREMSKMQNIAKKSLRKAYFKRLDNSSGNDRVTVEYYGSLTHDNEFDVLLGKIVPGGNTVGGPVGLDQVWGFVLDDGRRGLIRTSPFKATADQLLLGGTAAIETVIAPNSSPFTLYCEIKVQEFK